jgi:hypothetical protein
MKYFTPQMWIGFNSHRSKAALKSWDLRLKAYRQNLRKVLPGLNPQAQRFFRDVLILHDGTLTRMEVGDRIGNVDGKAGRELVNRRRAVVRLFVLSDIVSQRCYVLEYKNLDRIELNFPGQIALFPIGINTNFGDWGYDELTSPKKGLFRHEILFSSGATITIDCREISVRRKLTT